MLRHAHARGIVLVLMGVFTARTRAHLYNVAVQMTSFNETYVICRFTFRKGHSE